MTSLTDTSRAAELLRAGKLVAFPTETVYGLGADATSDEAVRKIFAAKGRPATNPLIVHVADFESAKRCVLDWPLAADALAKRFWPGPLTLVLPKAACIANVVTAGGSTVGVRVPNHPVALELLRAVNLPIAAPSANSSERISPTTALHVRLDLGEKVDLVLDGGSCEVGIESTVLDLSITPPMILRPGGITRDQIEAIIGPVNLPMSMTEPNAKSPGRSTRHYAPRTPAYRFEPGTLRTVPAGAVSMSLDSSTATMPNDPEQYAAKLYDTLRQLDGANATAIYIELPPDEPRWLAVRDRLMRAAQPVGGQDVACPMCSYSLRGLAEPRCPECGFAFDWAELLDPLRQKHPYLFEHHARRPFWSLIKTQIGGWIPKEFWTSLHPAQPSKPRMIAIYFAIVAFPSIAAATAIFVAESISYLNWSQTSGVPIDIRRLLRFVVDDQVILIAICSVLWPILTFLGLSIFRWSMRAHHVHQMHVIRCVTYCADLIFPLGLVLCGFAVFQTISQSNAGLLFASLDDGYLWAGTFTILVLFNIRLTRAYQRYLRFDHSLWTVLASQVVAGLALFKLLLVSQGN